MSKQVIKLLHQREAYRTQDTYEAYSRIQQGNQAKVVADKAISHVKLLRKPYKASDKRSLFKETLSVDQSFK